MSVFVFATALLLGTVSDTPQAPGVVRVAPVAPGAPAVAIPRRGDAELGALLSPVRPDGSSPRTLIIRQVSPDPKWASSERAIAESDMPMPRTEEVGIHALGTCLCSGAPAEGEAGCGLPTDNFNGGCNSAPNVYDAITLGNSICGTGAFDGGTRDTDWYVFTLTQTTTVRWTGRAEFPLHLLLMNTGPCFPAVLSSAFAPACTEASLVQPNLAPGNYIAFAAPQFAAVINCGTSDDYHASLTGVAACEYDDGVSEDTIGLGGFGGGEQLYLHRMGGVGELAQINSVSMAWGTPSFPGASVPNGTAAQIRIFKDPDDDGIPDDLVLVRTQAILTANVDTDILNTHALTTPLVVAGVYFVGVSIVSGPGQYPLAMDYTNPSALRGWFTGETNGSGGVLDYNNFANNDFFDDNAALGVDGVYLLRADCQPADGGCAMDDASSETTGGYSYAGEKLFLHRFGALGEVAQVSAISMAWGTPAIPGNSVPNGTGAQVRVFDDPDDDGIPDDAVLVHTQGLLTSGVDTGTFQTVALSSPVIVRGYYFVGASVVAAAGQYPMGFDLSTESDNRVWFVGQNGGAINYANLPAHTHFGTMPGVYGADGVHMLRADCIPRDEIEAFCFPSINGVRSCPCGNPASAADLGCDNFINSSTTSGTGGSKLTATGVPHASLASTLVFHVTKAHNPASNTNLHVFWKGASTLAVGVKSGFGVRCITGSLKRIYQGSGAGAGGLGSTNAVDFPNGVQTTNAWTASQMPVSGTTLYYYDSYRDQQGPTTCNTANDRFNVSHAISVIWSP